MKKYYYILSSKLLMNWRLEEKCPNQIGKSWQLFYCGEHSNLFVIQHYYFICSSHFWPNFLLMIIIPKMRLCNVIFYDPPPKRSGTRLLRYLSWIYFYLTSHDKRRKQNLGNCDCHKITHTKTQKKCHKQWFFFAVSWKKMRKLLDPGEMKIK